MDMSELNLLIVEDDKQTCRALSAYAETLLDVNIVGITATAKEAVQIISDFRPHAVILDLELSDGDGSGLDVLRGIKGANLGYKPFFLVTTVITSHVIKTEVRRLGGDYIVSKHMASYSEVYAIDFLRSMSGSIIQSQNSGIHISRTDKPQTQRIRQKIMAEMNWIGISPKIKGRPYLVSAIELLINRFNGNLYGELATRYGTTSDSVEQAMRYAIEKAWKTKDVDVLCEHFKARIRSDTGVPTTTEFIYYYAEKIGNELGFEF